MPEVTPQEMEQMRQIDREIWEWKQIWEEVKLIEQERANTSRENIPPTGGDTQRGR